MGTARVNTTPFTTAGTTASAPYTERYSGRVLSIVVAPPIASAASGRTRPARSGVNTNVSCSLKKLARNPSVPRTASPDAESR